MPPAAALYLLLFILGAVGEMSVPAIAERRGMTTWHREHIAERYSLLNIIVLAEIFIAVSAMIWLDPGAAFPDAGLLWLAMLAVIIAFLLWALYFSGDERLASSELRHALLLGYGHLALFAAGAATGAGLTVLMQVAEGSAPVGARIGTLAIAIPLAIYLGTLWLIRDRVCLSGAARWLLAAAAVLVLLIGFAAPFALELIALALVATALARRRLGASTETSHD